MRDTPSKTGRDTRVDVRRRRHVNRAALVAFVACVTAVGACGREAGVQAGRESAAARAATAHAPYDADSAARGLIAPELASLLAVEPLLATLADTSAAGGRRCKQDTLPDLRHVRLRFDLRRGDTVTTIFARRTPTGELRRAEVLRRLPDGTALGASWDAAEHATTVSEFSGGTVKKTTSRDDDAPLAHALRYVGRKTMGTRCGV